MVRAACGVGVCGALCLGTTPVWAAPPHIAVQLEYTRDPQVAKVCPEERALRGALSTKFGYDIVDAASPWRLITSVSRGKKWGRINAVMELRDAAGELKWRSHDLYVDFNDCRQLIEGMALSIRIQIDVLELAPSPPPVPITPPAAQATASPPPAPRARSSAAPLPASGPDGWVGMGSAVALGGAPDPALGLWLQGGLRWSHVSLSLEGTGNLPVSEDGISVSRFAGLFVPCGHYKFVFGCMLGTVGKQFVAAHNLEEEEEGSNWYFGSGVRIGVEKSLTEALALRISGDFMGAMPFADWHVGELEQWSTPRLYGALGVGMVVDL